MNIELPKDAEGREIPLDTVCMYDCNGDSVSVTRWCFTTRLDSMFSEKNIWIAIDKERLVKDPAILYITPPDSLKQLVGDIKRAQDACERNGDKTGACAYSNWVCDGCKLYHGDGTCSSRMLGDIAARIERLCGDAE